MNGLTLYHFVALSAIVFCIGMYGALSRRNVLGTFLSIELMFNAANINLVAFNHFLYRGSLWGQGFVLFIIALMAAEAVVGLSLVLSIYRRLQFRSTEPIDLLHG